MTLFLIEPAHASQREYAVSPSPQESQKASHASSGDDLPPRRLVITLHGIRTYGFWQTRLEKVVLDTLQSDSRTGPGTKPDFTFFHYRYGYFSVLAFMLPLLRWLVVRRFRKHLLDVIKDNPRARVYIVAHSFGTHLAAWALLGIPREKRPTIHTMIFAGSVLKVNFSWRELMEDDQVHRVINECGTGDAVLLVNQLFVLFTGMAGRVGFNGMEQRERFLNRYFRFGHSGYFGTKAGPSDDYMRTHWLPLLTTDALPEIHERESHGAFHGVIVFLLNNSEPLKLTLTVTPLILLVLFFFELWTTAKKEREDARKHSKIAQSRQVAASAISRLSYDPELSVLLAREAVRIEKTQEAENALRRALLESHVRVALIGHEEYVNSASFSPDGKWVVTASDDGTSRIWDSASGKERDVLKCRGSVISAEFSRDSLSVLLLTANADGNVLVWKRGPTGWKENAVLKVGRTLFRAVLSPDGKHILTGSSDGIARIWDVATQQRIVELKGHTGRVFSAAYSRDGKRVITAGEDGTACVWEWEKNPKKPIATLGERGKAIYSAEFSPDGKLVVTGHWDGTARVWKLPSGKVSMVLRGHVARVTSVAFSPDGKSVVTASRDTTARVWDTKGTLLAVLRGHRDVVYSAAFDPAGQRVVTASYDNTARIWEARPDSPKVSLPHAKRVRDAAFSTDGKWVATAADDGTARLWKWEEKQSTEPIILSGHKDRVTSVEFSPVSPELVVTASKDTTVKVWNWRSTPPKELSTLDHHKEPVNRARFSPDGHLIVTASDDCTAQVWEWEAKNLRATLRERGGRVRDAGFSPKGELVVTATQGKQVLIWRWDAKPDKPVVSLTPHRAPVYSAAFSRDGKWIVTASDDRTAQVWEWATTPPKRISVLHGHNQLVSSAAFSNAGSVVTASYDSTTRIWDPVLAEPFIVLRGHEDQVDSAAFSPDGQYVVTTGDDGTARIYRVPLGGLEDDLLELAQERVTRELTLEERRQYLPAEHRP